MCSSPRACRRIWRRLHPKACERAVLGLEQQRADLNLGGGRPDRRGHAPRCRWPGGLLDRRRIIRWRVAILQCLLPGVRPAWSIFLRAQAHIRELEPADDIRWRTTTFLPQRYSRASARALAVTVGSIVVSLRGSLRACACTRRRSVRVHARGIAPRWPRFVAVLRATAAKSATTWRGECTPSTERMHDGAV